MLVNSSTSLFSSFDTMLSNEVMESPNNITSKSIYISFYPYTIYVIMLFGDSID